MTPRAASGLLGVGAVLMCVLLYLGVSLTNLDRFPVIIGDEPGITAPAQKLAFHGVLGADMLTGYYRSEQHNYQFMPGYPVLVAGSFKLWGAGLVQARMVGIVVGLLTLLLTLVVGRWLVGWAAGVVAGILLVTWRITLWGGVLGSGIPLIDLSRIVRYDQGVAPCVLLATGLFVIGLRRQSRWRLVLAGFLVGLGTLFHLYGAFWLPALAALLFWRDGWKACRLPELYLFGAGFLLGVLPWLLFVAQDPTGYLGQMRQYHDRFQLLSLHFYLNNLRTAPDRYSFGFRSQGARLGSVFFIVAVPAAMAGLLWEAHRTRRLEPAAVALGWIVPQAFFALLINEELVNHIYALVPFIVLAVGWGAVRLWELVPKTDIRRRQLVRAAVGGILTLVAVNGLQGIVHLRQHADRTTPYSVFEQRLARLIPGGARILASPQYQLGLSTHPYREIYLLSFLTDSDSDSSPLTFGRALAQIAPDVLLVDRPLSQYYRGISRPSSPLHSQYLAYRRYLSRHHARLVGAVVDPSYNYSPVKVYVLDHAR